MTTTTKMAVLSGKDMAWIAHKLTDLIDSLKAAGMPEEQAIVGVMIAVGAAMAKYGVVFDKNLPASEGLTPLVTGYDFYREAMEKVEEKLASEPKH